MSAAVAKRRHRVKRAECTGASAPRQGKMAEFRPKPASHTNQLRKRFDNKGFFT